MIITGKRFLKRGNPVYYFWNQRFGLQHNWVHHQLWVHHQGGNSEHEKEMTNKGDISTINRWWGKVKQYWLILSTSLILLIKGFHVLLSFKPLSLFKLLVFFFYFYSLSYSPLVIVVFPGNKRIFFIANMMRSTV